MNERPASTRAHWTIPEAISFIFFGDPGCHDLLPDRGMGIGDYALIEIEAIEQGQPYRRRAEVTAHAEIGRQLDEFFQTASQFPEHGTICYEIARNRRRWKAKRDQAEAELATAWQTERIAVFGKRTPGAYDAPTENAPSEKIQAIDLFGEIALGSTLSKPRESRLHVTDRLTGRLDHAWSDVQVFAAEVKALFLEPFLPTARTADTATTENAAASTSDCVAAESGRSANDAEIEEAITEAYNRADEAQHKPPNIREIVPAAERVLFQRGLQPSKKQIRFLARQLKFQQRRLRRGAHRNSKSFQ
jgi:hypothetical protein